MNDEHNLMERAQYFIEHTVEYLTISFLLALSVLLVSSSWRKNKTYFLSAVIFGTVVGYGAGQTPMLAPFDIVLAIIACITAPTTILFFQHKTLVDVIRELKGIKDE